jgi:hypothetical protein
MNFSPTLVFSAARRLIAVAGLALLGLSASGVAARWKRECVGQFV